jgi:hypothetical protein
MKAVWGIYFHPGIGIYRVAIGVKKGFQVLCDQINILICSIRGDIENPVQLTADFLSRSPLKVKISYVSRGRVEMEDRAGIN